MVIEIDAGLGMCELAPFRRRWAGLAAPRDEMEERLVIADRHDDRGDIVVIVWGDQRGVGRNVLGNAQIIVSSGMFDRFADRCIMEAIRRRLGLHFRRFVGQGTVPGFVIGRRTQKAIMPSVALSCLT